MTTPHQSGAPFVSERVFKIKGFAGKRSLLFPPPPHSFHLFALAPYFVRPEYEKLLRVARVSFALVRGRLLRRLRRLLLCRLISLRLRATTNHGVCVWYNEKYNQKHFIFIFITVYSHNKWMFLYKWHKYFLVTKELQISQTLKPSQKY